MGFGLFHVRTLRKLSQSSQNTDLSRIAMATIIPLLTEFEKEHISERQALPEKYLGLTDEEMDRRIAAARATLGKRLVILGHRRAPPGGLAACRTSDGGCRVTSRVLARE